MNAHALMDRLGKALIANLMRFKWSLKTVCCRKRKIKAKSTPHNWRIPTPINNALASFVTVEGFMLPCPLNPLKRQRIPNGLPRGCVLVLYTPCEINWQDKFGSLNEVKWS